MERYEVFKILKLKVFSENLRTSSQRRSKFLVRDGLQGLLVKVFSKKTKKGPEYQKRPYKTWVHIHRELERLFIEDLSGLS